MSERVSEREMPNFRPVDDLIILDTNTGERKSRGGIILSDASLKGELRVGKVLACGPGRYENGVFIPMDIQAGDWVVYNSFSGSTVLIGDKKVFGVNRKGGIWGVVNDPEHYS